MNQRSHAAEIKASSVGKSFGNFWALKDLSLDIGRGEFLTLLGPSGSGKTTFLMILAGFTKPTTGRLMRDGRDITPMPAEDREAGMVFQGYALFPHMSVEDNIAFPLRVRKASGDVIRRKVGAMVERVGLRGHEKKRPAQLSGGQQQRVALARALVFEPSMLLLDEPFSALDKSLREQMQAEVARLHRETGTTFVFVTHDQTEALALSSRIAIFNSGQLLQVGDPREVYERPKNRFVAEFLGEINMLPLSGLSFDGQGANGAFEDRRIFVDETGGNLSGKDTLLGVRPEHMRLVRSPEGAVNALAAMPTGATYGGSATRLELATRSGIKLSLSVPTDEANAALASEGPVWLTWAPERGFLIPPSA
ncbi:ABC transporter ATP-binding protein [Mesorhizobium sp. RP14(2022)]|uniref:ABC transporter ATP-binding protein n=1 Tax=Mesorhizobium liriopis TaxID=2953882 RepID=A0ABT1C4R6_9HYPH|nr:ABC transporter ATP-binding protein [Mesorhizobium liriopis]MCO6049824.1 ABC transporter ATP-binding protein [Mesorhizobium liriopis]